MNDVRKHPCVQLRGQVYRFRMKVPTELVDVIGKKQITKSLTTSIALMQACIEKHHMRD
jgi:uncharacterized protein DUF6538